MRSENHFKFFFFISVSLLYLLAALSCAPTKVRTYPTETKTERTAPGRPSPGTPSPDKAASQKPEAFKPLPTKSYSEAVSEWKSYQELVTWMEKEFSFDAERYKKFQGTLPVPRSPEETFQMRSGIYIDAVEFARKTLNQINSSYKAQTAVIFVRPNLFNHYVCAFKIDGKFFVLDYGTPYKEITGFHGPYISLDEYKRYFEKRHPEKRTVEGIRLLP